MTTSAFACAGCGQPVPPGRLACPSCGELLASVGGGPAGAARGMETAAAPGTAPATRRTSGRGGRSAARAATAGSEHPASPPRRAAGAPAGRVAASREALPPSPLETPAPSLDAPAAPEAPTNGAVEFRPAVPIPPTGAFAPGMVFTRALDHIQPIAPDAPVQDDLGWPAEGAAARWSAALAAADARAGGTASLAAAEAPAGGTASLAAAEAPAGGTAAEARAGGTGPVAAAGGETAGVVIPRLPEGSWVPPRARRLPALVVPDRLQERVTGAAAFVVALGFLLPWARLVIGAPAIGEPWWGLGIMSTWGWVPFLGALGAAALALLDVPRLASWVRLGVVPLVLGTLVLGIAWPYAFGPIGDGPGLTFVVLGSVACVALGLFGLRLGRAGVPASGPDRPSR